MEPKKKKRKSKRYQYKIVEVSFDQVNLNNFPNERSIGNILNDQEIDEKIQELRSELLKVIYEMTYNKVHSKWHIIRYMSNDIE